MDAISYTAARANLASKMDKVCSENAPVIITRKNKSPVVMMSLEDYQAMEEITYLLRSPYEGIGKPSRRDAISTTLTPLIWPPLIAAWPAIGLVALMTNIVSFINFKMVRY